MNISKKVLFDKLSKLNSEQIKKIGLNNDEISYLKNKILNDKLGLVLNFEEKDEYLDNHYFGLEEIKELGINLKEKNNNLLIEGDNYYALKALQASGIKVDVIYIDPPYNTGKKDFIYNDTFVDKDDKYKHSKWLSFMKKRLILARELMANDGIIFVSIDDNEQAYLKVLMDEIFGEGNFICCFVVENNPKGRKNNDFISLTHEYCLSYAKNKSISSFKNVVPKHANDMIQDENGQYVRKSGKRVLVGENDLNGFVDNFESDKHYSLYINNKTNEIIVKKEYKIHEIDKKLISLGFKRYFSHNNNNFVYNTYTSTKIVELFNNNELDIRNNKIYEKHFSNMMQLKSCLKNQEYDAIINNKKIKYQLDLKTTSANEQIKQIFGTKIFKEKEIFPKNLNFIRHLISLINIKNPIVLDFFAGSGTTAQAVMELNEEDGSNRRFILCTNNENNIAQDICRERIYRVINGEGSNNEKIEWQYSKDKKSLNTNSMKYLRVKPIHNKEGNYEDINDMKEIYQNEFNKNISIKDFN